MKYSIGILVNVILVAAFVLSACDSSSKKVKKAENSVIEVNQDLENANNKVKAEVRIYRLNNIERIKEFNRTISGINQKIDKEPDLEVRERLEKKLVELEVFHHNLKRKMDNYEASGRENWDEFKDNFSGRMDDLGNSLKDFFSATGTTSSTN